MLRASATLSPPLAPAGNKLFCQNGKVLHLYCRLVELVAHAMANEVIASRSVIDFDGINIDRILSSDLMARLVEAIKQAYTKCNLEEFIVPKIVTASIGATAKAPGVAILPLYSVLAQDREILLMVDELH